MNRKLTTEQREEVFRSIEKEWQSICDSVGTSIEQALTKDRSIKKSINRVAYEFMQTYKESLKSARILVD